MNHASGLIDRGERRRARYLIWAGQYVGFASIMMFKQEQKERKNIGIPVVLAYSVSEVRTLQVEVGAGNGIAINRVKTGGMGRSTSEVGFSLGKRRSSPSIMILP